MTMLEERVSVPAAATFSVTGGLAQDFIDKGQMIPWSGVVVVEGASTGDKRSIEMGALSHRPLPLPMMVQLTNPVAGDGHDGATLSGRIDTLERQDDGKWLGTGFIDPTSGGDGDTPAGTQLALALDKQLMRGVSVDLDRVAITERQSKDGPRQAITSARIIGATATVFPAFAECEIALDVDRMSLAASAAVFADWEDAIEGHVAQVWTPVDAYETMIASAGMSIPVDPPAEWFARREFTELTPLTVLANGRVFGHIAANGTCHISFANKCEPVPRSNTNYAKFRNASTLTAEGTMVRTGPIVMDTVHPDLRWRASDAQSFYADTGAAVCDVVPYDDEFGMAVVGAMRPDVAPAKIRAFRGSDISPDWRNIDGYRRECCALLAVNNSGFKLPQSLAASAGMYIEPGETAIALDADDDVYALVASGPMRVEPCCDACASHADAVTADATEQSGSLDDADREVRLAAVRGRFAVEAAVRRDDEIDDDKARRRADVRARFGPKPARMFRVAAAEFVGTREGAIKAWDSRGRGVQIGDSVVHREAGTSGKVIDAVESQSPYNPGPWVRVRNDDDGFEYWTQPDSVLKAGDSPAPPAYPAEMERAVKEWQRGDNLDAIARRYELDPALIMDEVKRRQKRTFHVASGATFARMDEFAGTSEGARKAWLVRGRHPDGTRVTVRHDQGLEEGTVKWSTNPTAQGDEIKYLVEFDDGTQSSWPDHRVTPVDRAAHLKRLADEIPLGYGDDPDSEHGPLDGPAAADYLSGLDPPDRGLAAQWQDSAPDMSYDDWLKAEVQNQHDMLDADGDPEEHDAAQIYIEDLVAEMDKREKARGDAMLKGTKTVPTVPFLQGPEYRKAVKSVARFLEGKSHDAQAAYDLGKQLLAAKGVKVPKNLDAVKLREALAKAGIYGSKRSFRVASADFAGTSEGAIKAWLSRDHGGHGANNARAAWDARHARGDVPMGAYGPGKPVTAAQRREADDLEQEAPYRLREIADGKFGTHPRAASEIAMEAADRAGYGVTDGPHGPDVISPLAAAMIRIVHARTNPPLAPSELAMQIADVANNLQNSVDPYDDSHRTDRTFVTPKAGRPITTPRVRDMSKRLSPRIGPAIRPRRSFTVASAEFAGTSEGARKAWQSRDRGAKKIPTTKVSAAKSTEIARNAYGEPTTALEDRGELYRDGDGHEVWRILDANGKVFQDGIASDHDAKAIAEELVAYENQKAAPNEMTPDEFIKRDAARKAAEGTNPIKTAAGWQHNPRLLGKPAPAVGNPKLAKIEADDAAKFGSDERIVVHAGKGEEGASAEPRVEVGGGYTNNSYRLTRDGMWHRSPQTTGHVNGPSVLVSNAALVKKLNAAITAEREKRGYAPA